MNPNFYDQDDPILSREDAIAILDTPDEKLDDLIARAEGLRRKYKGNRVSIHILTNARSGNCSQDCAYCAQSCRSKADIEKYKWVDEEKLYHDNDFVNEHHLSRHCIGLSGMKFTDAEIEELARRIRREVLRVQSGEADEEIRADREREQAEEEARQEEQRKEERRRSNIFCLLFSGNILVRKGASEYYRYMICIAAMFFVSIFVMFTALHLDMKYSRLYREVQMLRERSTRLQEQRFRHTTHSAILEELRRRGIDLYDPVVPGEILDD